MWMNNDNKEWIINGFNHYIDGAVISSHKVPSNNDNHVLLGSMGDKTQKGSDSMPDLMSNYKFDGDNNGENYLFSYH